MKRKTGLNDEHIGLAMSVELKSEKMQAQSELLGTARCFTSTTAV